MTSSDFLGLGWNFPIGLDEDGQVELTPDGEEGVRQSIWMILGTSRGERVMRDVYAVPDPSRPSLLTIEINYQVRSTNSRFNLVYPFYLE
jgi:hypothetical protein